MILREQKVFYFHVPKTGGFSMEQFLLPGKRDYRVYNQDLIFGLYHGYMTQHIAYRDLLSMNLLDEETLNSCFKFAFFRNTWDRLCSAYFYLPNQYSKRFGNFENCIKNACETVKTGDYKSSWHFGKQTNFLFKSDKSKDLALDFVGRFENMEQDFKFLLTKINRPEDSILPKLNQSKNKKKGPFQKYYSKELQLLVAEAYAEEIEYFKYEF